MIDESEANAYDKILKVLRKIKHQMLLENRNGLLFYSDDFGMDFSNVQTILTMLMERKIIKMLAWGEPEIDNEDPIASAYQFKVYPEKFENYFKEIQIKDKQSKEILKNYDKFNDNIYKVIFSEITREIRVNNFLLAKPDFASVNLDVFEYLYNHPNQKITFEEIKKETKIETAKRLHDIVRDLGFRGELLKIFFAISKTSIMFRNPIERKDLDELGIRWISFKPKDVELD